MFRADDILSIHMHQQGIMPVDQHMAQSFLLPAQSWQGLSMAALSRMVFPGQMEEEVGGLEHVYQPLLIVSGFHQGSTTKKIILPV